MINLELTEGNMAMVNLFVNDAPKRVIIVASRALNRVIGSVKSKQIQDAKEKYTLLNSMYYNGVTLSKSTPGNLEASVNAQGSPISLEYFKISSKKRINRNKLIVEVKKGQAKSLGDAFIGYYHKGTVFQREGAERVPLKTLYGPSLPQMFGEQSIIQKLLLFSNDKFNERFEHEFQYEFMKG